MIQYRLLRLFDVWGDETTAVHARKNSRRLRCVLLKGTDPAFIQTDNHTKPEPGLLWARLELNVPTFWILFRLWPFKVLVQKLAFLFSFLIREVTDAIQVLEIGYHNVNFCLNTDSILLPIHHSRLFSHSMPYNIHSLENVVKFNKKNSKRIFTAMWWSHQGWHLGVLVQKCVSIFVSPLVMILTV